MLFRFQDISKEFGTQKLFEGVTVQCNPGDRIGLIGRNGTGKTTLFDLIEGHSEADSGRVTRAKGLAVSRVEQIPSLDRSWSVREAAIDVFGDLIRVEEEVESLEARIASVEGAIPVDLAGRYELLRTRLRLHGGYDYRNRAEAVLLGVGLEKDCIDEPWSRLSGGQASRLLVARALLRPCELVLLDEPTNHLDIQAILWLTGFLRSLPDSLVVISHDRTFLDEVTRTTWEIEGTALNVYPAAFSRSRTLRDDRRSQQQKAYEEQQQWRARTEDYIRRNIAGQKTKQAQSRRRALSKTVFLEAPAVEIPPIRLALEESRRGGALTFAVESGSFGYPGRTLLQGISLSVHRGDRVGIVGPNGSGKSTFLKVLIGELQPLSGQVEWGPNNDVAYYSQNSDISERDGTVYDFFRRIDSRCPDGYLKGYAALFLFRGDDLTKPIEALSGGERSRLALARLISEPCNVLILDEPTNHLDITSREALEGALQNFTGTILAVSHDRRFLERVTDRYLVMNGGSIREARELAPALAGFAEGRVSARERKSAAGPRVREESKPSKNRIRRQQETVASLEKEVSAAEARKSELLIEMEGASGDFERLREFGREHQQVESELESLYHRWEQESEELARMNSGAGGQGPE